MPPSTRQARPPAAAGVPATAAWMLEREARALMTLLAGVKPFAVQETMLPAAAITPAALVAIERVLITERAKLRRRVLGYIRWLREDGRSAEPSEMQRRFALLRVAFNDVLSQFDLFSDAITQRSEQEIGLWLSGLDVFAADALALPGYYEPPQVVCHLDRGPGAAVRRARTRLPGNVLNPVAIVRVPRERMVGQGIASSLVHEVGHQAAALLDFVPAARAAIQESGRRAPQQDRKAWEYLDRCASEIVADLWSVATLGIGSTLGLIGVVSLPRYFVFAYHPEDPHPLPLQPRQDLVRARRRALPAPAVPISRSATPGARTRSSTCSQRSTRAAISAAACSEWSQQKTSAAPASSSAHTPPSSGRRVVAATAMTRSSPRRLTLRTSSHTAADASSKMSTPVPTSTSSRNGAVSSPDSTSAPSIRSREASALSPAEYSHILGMRALDPLPPTLSPFATACQREMQPRRTFLTDQAAARAPLR